jgi:hypothetical protein
VTNSDVLEIGITRISAEQGAIVSLED